VVSQLESDEFVVYLREKPSLLADWGCLGVCHASSAHHWWRYVGMTVQYSGIFPGYIVVVVQSMLCYCRCAIATTKTAHHQHLRTGRHMYTQKTLTSRVDSLCTPADDQLWEKKQHALKRNGYPPSLLAQSGHRT